MLEETLEIDFMKYVVFGSFLMLIITGLKFRHESQVDWGQIKKVI